MQSEIDNPISFGPPSETDSLKQRISKLEAENNVIKAENVRLKDERNRMLNNIARNQTRINELQRENIALQLLNQRNTKNT